MGGCTAGQVIGMMHGCGRPGMFCPYVNKLPKGLIRTIVVNLPTLEV